MNAEQNGNLVKTLIQGGLVSICLASLWVIYSLVSNHMVHNTETINLNTQAIIELKGAINTLNNNNVSQALMIGQVKDLMTKMSK